MSGQGDDAEVARRRRAATVHLLERAQHLGTVLMQHPDLGVLFDLRTDRQTALQAKVRSAIRDAADLGDLVMARRLEEALERPTKPGVKAEWGRTRSRRYLFEELRREIANQPRPNVSAAAKAIAAREGGGVLTEAAVRQEWNKIAQDQGLTGKELAHRVWQEARDRSQSSA